MFGERCVWRSEGISQTCCFHFLKCTAPFSLSTAPSPNHHFIWAAPIIHGFTTERCEVVSGYFGMRECAQIHTHTQTHTRKHTEMKHLQNFNQSLSMTLEGDWLPEGIRGLERPKIIVCLLAIFLRCGAPSNVKHQKESKKQTKPDIRSYFIRASEIYFPKPSFW